MEKSRRFIPYGRQCINESDIKSVLSVLRSDYLTQGPCVKEFESRVAAYCGARYAVAVSNGTAALHVASLAAGLKSGKSLWTSPNTFVASANCALYCGGGVDFVDIEPDTYNLSVNALESKLEDAELKGALPGIVIPVHFAGQSCDMEKIHQLSIQYGFSVIEDACHAIGGEYKAKKVGSCQFSDMVVFSFHPVKIITSGEGGMVLTNTEDLYKKLLLFRNHGITRDAELMDGEPDGPWYYQQIGLGMNYRITDMQAALGISQLARVDEFVKKRRELAKRYDEELSGLPLTTPVHVSGRDSAFHLYVVRVKFEELQRNKKEIFISLRKNGIGVNVHYIPVHTQPFYRNLGFTDGQFPVAEAYYEEALTLPLFPAMSLEEQDRVIEEVKELLN